MLFLTLTAHFKAQKIQMKPFPTYFPQCDVVANRAMGDYQDNLAIL